MITEKTTLEELFALAKEACGMVAAEENFMVRDLFTGLEWNRIPKGLRTKLGAMFLQYVKSQMPPVFEPAGKTLQNQQIYRRI